MLISNVILNSADELKVSPKEEPMKMSKLLIAFIILTCAFQAIARKPAVEDFVGVETETYKPTPAGSEVVFNFGNHVIDSRNQSFFSQNAVSIVVSFAFLALPFLMWFGLKKFSTMTPVQVTEEEVTPSFEQDSTTHSNVAKLEDFRNAEDKDKKAS